MISALSNSELSANRLIAAMGASRVAGIRARGPAGAGAAVEEPLSAGAQELPVGKSELTDEERAEVQRLRERDTEVRRHEQSHKTAAGQYASGNPTYEYETGPDGKRYAVGGEVEIDTSEVQGDPGATLRKMAQVRRAAMAPATPSGQDRRVAAKASAAERRAQQEIADQRAEDAETGDPSSRPPAVTGGTSQSPLRPASAARAPDAADPSGTDAHRSGPSEKFSLFESAFAAQTTQPVGRFIDVAA